MDITPPLHDHPVQEGELVIAVAHGFTGGSHEHYVRAALTSLTSAKDAGGLGARAVVLNYRGCNGSPVITPRLYHVSMLPDGTLLRCLLITSSLRFYRQVLLTITGHLYHMSATCFLEARYTV